MAPHTNYRWTYRTNGTALAPENSGQVKKLADELTISPVLAEILVRRNIDTFEKSKAFFRPSLDDLHDPFLCEGMHHAVERLVRAVERNERIVVYGDYDVDGTNGTALLWSFFKHLNADAEYFIPDRIKEGYGLSVASLERVREMRPNIIVSVDCGVTAVQPVEHARTLGIDVVICDHHEPGDPLPRATAILDPLVPACGYPFKYLCGCGVGFKLVQALLSQKSIVQRLDIDPQQLMNSFLQYVTLATLADIVTLQGENRTLVKIGLELINANPLPGIFALIESSRLKVGNISSGQVVFVLAPRINAVGRLGDAKRAVELLTCTSIDRARELAQVLENENAQRRRIDEETFAQAQVLAEPIASSAKVLVLHQPHWHPGVIGIVASRLVERFYRPTVMLTTVDGVAKGSARSVSGYNVYEALRRCQSSIIQFGGHKYAAGLTVELDKVGEFREKFQSVADELLNDDLLTPKIQIDADIALSELTGKFVRVLSQFAPFGPDNMRPVFATHNVEVVGTPRIVGKNHLRFKVKSNGHIVDAIGFNLGELISRVQPGQRGVSLAFSLDEGEFAGSNYPQLKIRDIKVATPQVATSTNTAAAS
ncbi:MAG: single-stranded-DNA-specific exonuclease RecJ [Ignavibacteriales bacterium]|nr:single-stranded-DNA-specific exonuclease RecJ [Ignavibacteriales bacterium]